MEDPAGFPTRSKPEWRTKPVLSEMAPGIAGRDGGTINQARRCRPLDEPEM